MKQPLTEFWISQPAAQPNRAVWFRTNCSTARASGYLWASLVLFLAMICAGCHKKNTVGIDVDLYLHPEAADSQDLLLQTAVQDQLDKNAVTHNSLIHVRVVHKLVFLDGSVDTQKEKDEAETIAKNTTVAVNGVAIHVDDVKTHIDVQP